MKKLLKKNGHIGDPPKKLNEETNEMDDDWRKPDIDSISCQTLLNGVRHYVSGKHVCMR